MKLLIILLLFIILILIISLYYNNYIDNFAVFDGVKPIARVKVAGTGTAGSTDNATDALQSTFNFTNSKTYAIVSDSVGNLFILEASSESSAKIRKLTKLGNQKYGSVTMTTNITLNGLRPTITIDSADNIYIFMGGTLYRSPKPGTDNRIVFTTISPSTNILIQSGGENLGMTTDGTNIFCMSFSGLIPFIVKFSPPTSGTVWNQQRLYPSTSTSGAPVTTGLTSSNMYKGLIYAKGRNELAFTTHWTYKVIIMNLNNKTTTATKPAGAFLADEYFTTTLVAIDGSLPYGITYSDNYYYVFEAENTGGRPVNTLRRINMTTTPPRLENFFGPAKTPKVANYYSKSFDNPAVNGLGTNMYAGCFDPSGALFIMEGTQTIVMIFEYDVPIPSAMTNVTDGTRIKMSPTDATIATAGIASQKLMVKDADLGEYAYDFDGTKSLTQPQINPCIERNALFNINNTGAVNRCVVMNEAGQAIPVPAGKKGADVCGPNQIFWPPTCYNKTSPFMDYGEFSPTLDPMPTIEINKIEQFKRKKNMLMTAGQLNVPKDYY